MLRSPFLYFIFFLFLFSCKDKETIILDQSSLQKESQIFQKKGLANLQEKNFNTAFYNLNKSKIAFETLKDSANVVYNLVQMANIQQINGDYYGSRETLTEALPYIIKKGVYSAAINNLFGIADKELSNFDDAIYYYNETLKDCTDSLCKKSPLNNIAVVYIKQKKYDKAIKILESILDPKIAVEDPENRNARVLDNLGYALYKKKLNEKGLLLMLKSLNLRQTNSDDYGSIESYLHLSDYYFETDSQKSKQFALKAYETSTKLRSVDERLKALSFLMTNNSVANNTEYAKKFTFINDSITKIRNNFKNKFAKIKYDSKKEKDENQKLRLEKAENLLALQEAQKERIIFYAIFTAIFIFIVFLVVYLTKRHKHKTRLVEITTAYNTETRIAKDIHDELANDVFDAMTFAQTQSLTTENNKEPLLQKLNDIYSRVRGISRENSNIDNGINFSFNLKEMLSNYNTPDTNVIITNIEKVNWNEMEEEKKVTVHRVLQELMVNMKKHSQAPLVSVKFESTSTSILIDYSDKGKGCEKSKIVKNGLQNMENRISAIKGTITFDTEPNKGFKVKITMPK